VGEVAHGSLGGCAARRVALASGQRAHDKPLSLLAAARRAQAAPRSRSGTTAARAGPLPPSPAHAAALASVAFPHAASRGASPARFWRRFVQPNSRASQGAPSASASAPPAPRGGPPIWQRAPAARTRERSVASGAARCRRPQPRARCAEIPTAETRDACASAKRRNRHQERKTASARDERVVITMTRPGRERAVEWSKLTWQQARSSSHRALLVSSLLARPSGSRC